MKIIIAIAAIVALSGCQPKIADGQPDKVCEKREGSDRFLLRPSHEETEVIRRNGEHYVEFEDGFSGKWRVMKDTDFLGYDCWTQDGEAEAGE